jgi:signal transduction histidine kinase
VRRADKIVGNLLDFTRARVGTGIPLKLARTNLTALCEGIVLEARVYHPAKTIHFEAQGEWFCEVDGSRMEQVFSNLLNNAIKHGSELEPVTVTEYSHAGCAVFKFHNEGPAIPSADFERIFDPMTRNSQKAISERGPEAGLGLGLFIAREIVTAHGGEIQVESSQAEGTDFTVSIPSAKQPS